MDDPLTNHLEPSRIPIGVDPGRYYRRFLENSPRLFNSLGDVEHLEVVRVLMKKCRGIEPRWESVVESRQVESTHALEEHIKMNKLSAQHSLYLIRQRFSWGRFRISEFTLKSILSAHHVFLPFLDLIQAYGSKMHEDHHNWTGFRSHISKQLGVEGGSIKHEFCYNLQYMEKNNRGKGDPWSLRQLEVYHQISISSRRSIWIILQLPNGVYAQLEQVLKSNAEQGREFQAIAIHFHAIFCSLMADNWQEYLEYLQSQVSSFDEKACFSRVGVDYDQDYAVTFSDCQNLQLLQQKLLRTSTLLDACWNVVRGCAEHCLQLARLKPTGSSMSEVSEIKTYMTQLKQHRQTNRRIIKQSIGAGRLLSRILEFRNDKILRESNHAMQANLGILQQISSESREENKLLLKLAQQGRRDSRTLKAFTSVATMYLPASLIATMFSSSLIQTQSNVGSTDSKDYLAISSHFWVFVLSSIALTFVTFAFTLLVQRIWHRYSELPCDRSKP